MSRGATTAAKAAHRAAARAEAAGLLVRPSACQECGAVKYLVKHHYKGYRNGDRLAVLFICNRCHARHHREGNKMRAMKGGIIRASKLSASRRSEIARKGGLARQAKAREKSAA